MESSGISSDQSNSLALLQSLSKFDILALSFLGIGAVWYIFYKLRKPKEPRNYILPSSKSPSSAPGSATTDTSLVAKLKQGGKSLVVFYGSQTGTAEGFANSLVKEAARYGIRGLVVDLEEVQLEDLERIGGEIDECVAIFCMATYGEGDPTDNAQVLCILFFVSFLQVCHSNFNLYSQSLIDFTVNCLYFNRDRRE